IDELKNDEEIQEIFLSNATPSEEDNLFYNSWSDKNFTTYLANSCKKDKILFNINEGLEKKQCK
ncbi:13616_t:CDS:1, partial [Gigaspora margarita]